MAGTRGKSLPVDEQKAAVVLTLKEDLPVDWETLLPGISRGNTALEYGANHVIFMQGQPADSMFFLTRGKVRLTLSSAVLAPNRRVND